MADIQKLTYPYFTDGSTQLNATNLNPIIAKINEVIDKVNGGVTPTQTVATPTISISGSTATISCSTSGATIYYTTNGNTPTTSSTQYSNPITLSGACTIKAIAVKSGMTNSVVASQSYNPSVTVQSPTMSLNAGKLTLSSSTAGATIYYTLDGSTPTSSSTQYQSAITLTENCTIKAIAIKDGSSSTVTTKTYSITILGTSTTSISWTDNYTIRDSGQPQNTGTDYPGVFSIGKPNNLPSGITHLCYTRIILTAEDPDGYVAFYSGTEGSMTSTNRVGTPVALPKTASERGTYDTASIEIPEGAERFRIPFWTDLKSSAKVWYESLT